MKKPSNPSGFESFFFAVSTSLLLATPVESQALDLDDQDPFPAFAVPTLTLQPVSISGLGRETLGAFSEQRAQRDLLPEPDLLQSQWAQFFPSAARPAATVHLEAPGNDLRMSPDLFVRETAGGSVHRAGIFVGHSDLQSGFDGKRPQLGEKNNNVRLQGESVGMYWSMRHEQGWHVDAVAMGTRFDASGRNDAGERIDGDGHALTFSVEGGFPIGLGKNWVIEPQAQLVNQQYFAASQAQAEALQAYDGQPSWSGRVGAKLSGHYVVSGMPIEPYVRTNVWYDFSNADTVSLDKVDKISSGRNAATVELGLGLVARVTPKVALFVSADYSSDVDDNDLNGLIGNLGVRVRW
ncbi:autotransporter outer membrane beta-barrel domain-containing protein [Pseudomonas sp. zfem002]|uniref:autotransporter outer membrane beta-barrel domain-containing protein n=1 Tax=Pseudomonas sp. zfem002 TaxID=3078197 RepID=UPI002928C74D|nr:autotransporter outer membrane beta-barrel domain-containing protein [Pseudomonas sp. zfem002]MDU9393380.1 autotransporter outer membrane beta-barrel domain-containing protein [Pseudomonas sp. zfem002]